jgi:hypothetical protein
VSELPRTKDWICGDQEAVEDLVVPRDLLMAGEQRQKLRLWVAEMALRAVRSQEDGDERA